MGNILELTDETFASEVLETDQTVLVDFWAPWCGPCRALMPIIDQLAEANEGTAKICKVNIDDCGQTALNCKVSSIPTIMVFKGGNMLEMFEQEGINAVVTFNRPGVLSQQQLQEAINEAKGVSPPTPPTLGTCPDCKEQISLRATTCPHCGATNN